MASSKNLSTNNHVRHVEPIAHLPFGANKISVKMSGRLKKMKKAGENEVEVNAHHHHHQQLAPSDGIKMASSKNLSTNNHVRHVEPMAPLPFGANKISAKMSGRLKKMKKAGEDGVEMRN
ncbi:putative acetyl-CoA synthetase [Corchorus olitorius]|uniref:Acetyl-CoA synthetase n=1 Tax=Corchorus olitorius TaxID=93759 RepID=A0A1R3KGR8_9ROSI|nr:putative acetyl-CoA synthetase [Corchorus olitorius]